MPVYEYQEGNRTVLRRVPVADRDKFPGRVTVPSRINVCPQGEPTAGSQVLRGFAKCEESFGTEKVRQCANAVGLTRDQVKTLWKNDTN